MGPKTLCPVVNPPSHIKYIESVDVPLTITAELTKIETAGLEIGQRFHNQFTRPCAIGNRRICVMRTIMRSRIILRHNIRIRHFPVRVVVKIIPDRTIISKSIVPLLITEVVDFLLVYCGADIGKLNQKTETDVISNGLPPSLVQVSGLAVAIIP